MAEYEIPDRIKSFLFHHIDSVEQLEILLFLSSDKAKSSSAQALSDQLRSSLHSVQQRLTLLQAAGLIQATTDEPARYFFSPPSEETESLIRELDEIYRIKRHRILELLFSSMRKAKYFAEAFRINSSKAKKEDDHG